MANQDEQTRKYYVVVMHGDRVIASTQNGGSLSATDVTSATKLVVHNAANNTDTAYSMKINADGTISSLDGNSTLNRSEIMQLLGQNNYNTMLSNQKASLPNIVESLDSTTVQINNEQVKPKFIVYSDGQVFIQGMNAPISKEKLKEKFPETYKKIYGTDDTDNNSPQNGGGGGGGTNPGAPPVQPNTPPGAAPSGGGGSFDLLVNYDDISSVYTAVKSDVAKMSKIVSGYNSLIKVVGAGGIWSGADATQFTGVAEGYGTYLSDIVQQLNSTNEMLSTIIENFETTENLVGK